MSIFPNTMHCLILSSTPLLARQYSEALRRENIDASTYSIFNIEVSPVDTNLVFIPHELSELEWRVVLNHFKTMDVFPIVLSSQIPYGLLNTFPNWIQRWMRCSPLLSISECARFIKEFLNESIQKPSLSVQYKGITINKLRWQLGSKDKNIQFTKKEFSCLDLLLSSNGEVITREKLVEFVWGRHTYVSPNTIDVYISRLRKKLKDCPKHFNIRTLPCLGYSLELQERK